MIFVSDAGHFTTRMIRPNELFRASTDKCRAITVLTSCRSPHTSRVRTWIGTPPPGWTFEYRCRFTGTPLGAGELAAISWRSQLDADLVLMDDLDDA